jgi:hypothetical protein
MSLSIECPYCTHRYRVADDLEGHRLLCPECDGRFRAGKEMGQARPAVHRGRTRTIVLIAAALGFGTFVRLLIASFVLLTVAGGSNRITPEKKVTPEEKAREFAEVNLEKFYPDASISSPDTVWSYADLFNDGRMYIVRGTMKYKRGVDSKYDVQIHLHSDGQWELSSINVDGTFIYLAPHLRKEYEHDPIYQPRLPGK